MENIDIDIDIDKEILENIDIDIDIDIDKDILENIDIDKISNRLEFGISNRASPHPTPILNTNSCVVHHILSSLDQFIQKLEILDFSLPVVS